MTVSQAPPATSYSTGWNISLQAGGKLLPIGQKLSLDGNHFIALFKHQIKVYHLATRQCIKTISIDLSDLTIIDSKMSQQNLSYFYIFGKDGEVIVVNWKDKLPNSIVDRYQLSIANNSILKIVSFDPERSEIVAICGKYSTSRTSPRTTHILHLQKGEKEKELLSIQHVMMFKASIDHSRVAFLNNNNEIISVTLEGTKIGTTQTIPFVFKSKITCIAIANSTGIIALGTSSGIVQLIYGSNLDKPQRLLKWHIDQVKSLEFNQDDTYLLSGGEEKVLVLWQLDTDKQQFLPRLNGIIDNITIDQDVPELYSITLSVTDTNELEFLVLSALDLGSRLNVDGLRPNFNLNSMNKLSKKLSDSVVSDIKNDFTCSIAINPLTNHLYVPNGSAIQVYDFQKDEQLFIQTAVSASQVGKVKSEQLIMDPKVEIITFSEDGKWMCTFDSVPTPELDNLLSTKDIHYSLKFWKYIETAKDPKQSYWELSTKIIDPHGDKTPIVAIAAGPTAYHNGLAFLTADTKGGVRLWRPRVPKEIYSKVASNNNEKLQQTAWILKKSFNGNGTFETNSVALSWAQDASIIIIGYENSLNLIDCNTFKEVDEFHLPSLLGSRVRAVHIVDNNVIALAKNRIVSYDLLNAKNNELCGKLQTPTNGKNLIAVNTNGNLIALVVNFFNKVAFQSKVFIFTPQSLNPIYIGRHKQYISSITFAPSLDAFVFVDADSRIGTISSTMAEKPTVIKESNYAFELNVLLNNSQQQVNDKKVFGGPVSGNDDIDIAEEGAVLHGNVLNSHSFERVFENVDGVQLESLFERIMNIL